MRRELRKQSHQCGDQVDCRDVQDLLPVWPQVCPGDAAVTETCQILCLEMSVQIVKELATYMHAHGFLQPSSLKQHVQQDAYQ